ncbi:PAS domain S-box protein [Salinirarus marinus]|uniref:hybrid sensor histidine kinase/response regulator n=1 Tax=Salinirarus marinus TaxID=3068310 RepID=UPI003C6CC121
MSFPRTPATGEIRVLYVSPDSVARGVTAAIEREYERATVEQVRPEKLTARVDDVDCVVSEHRPPEVDGIEVLRAVRRRAPDLPFVLFPSQGDETVAADAVAAGVSEYVPRGSDTVDRLASAVERAVAAECERDRLEDARRVAAVVRDVTHAVVSAETREELERTVCSRLGESDQYQFVWWCRVDGVADAATPNVVAGDDEGYLDDVALGERQTGRGPTGDALRTGEIQVTQDVREDPAFDPCREAALERGILAAAAVPVVYEDTTYGVLSLYANRPWAFNDSEHELLGDLGNSMAHGIHHQETRSDLQTFRKAVEHAGHTVYITRRDGTIEYVNPRFEEVTGYDAETAIGRTPSILKSGEHGTEFYRRLWSTVLSGEVWTNEIVNRREDGTKYHVNQTIAPITDGEGNVDRFVAVNDDITEKKRQQRALKRQNERLNRFTSIVSHDLRNPLNVAQGELQRARAGEPDRLDAVERSLDRMERLIEDLLHLSKQGETIDEPSPVALEPVVRTAWETTDTADATLDVDVGDATVVADRDRLVRVFANLFRNAVEHGSASDRGSADDAVEHDSVTQRSATASVQASATGDRRRDDANDEVRITVGVDGRALFVADDGPGIPPSDREDVFDHAYTTSDGGTGLGLAIVDSIAKAHGWGTRATESEAGGARIEFHDVEFA